ncbi:13276_t:CDS:2, partial [Racocetra fulgida]
SKSNKLDQKKENEIETVPARSDNIDDDETEDESDHKTLVGHEDENDEGKISVQHQELANMNHCGEISISQDEIFDKIHCGSCYQNNTNLGVGRKKMETKDIDEDKEDCRTLET